MCRNDSQDYLCEETCLVSDLLSTEFAGFLYKCVNPIDFCHFNIVSIVDVPILLK